MGRWRKPDKKTAIEDRKPSHREAGQWSARFSIDASMAMVTVSMSKTGLTDDDMERWCLWLRSHLSERRGCSLALVDFSENRLTATGVRHLLETFLDLQLPVQVLKLHHNRIAEGSCFAAYVQRGWLHELHLSHNELDAEASASIIEAAVHAEDASTKIYPRKVGKGNSAPLWVRLEQNYIDPNVFSSILDAKFGESGRSICCDARSKWCTPHNCVQQAAFAVHLKNLSQQRRGHASQVSSSPATGSITRKADGTECAHILCFDWERGSWMPESIEIPAIASGTAELSEGLKVLIGAGMRRSSEEERKSNELQAISHEEGQTMGADLLRSIRNDPKKQPALAAHIMALPAAAAQAVAAQAAAAQAAAARAAAHAAHVRHARLAAAQLMASREEDPNAWLRIEAPVFQPGARCFFATSEAPFLPDVSDAHLLSAETSAGAASDDTESLEVATAGASGEGADAEPGLLNTDSPSSTTRRWEGRSPAAWLSQAAPLLDELPETSLWKKDRFEAKLPVEPEKAAKNAKFAQPVSPPILATTASKAGFSNFQRPVPKMSDDNKSSPAQWLSEVKKAEATVTVATESSASLSAPEPVQEIQEDKISIQQGPENSSIKTEQSPASPASPASPVPPEIEKPLVLHEEIPEVVGKEAEQAAPEVLPEQPEVEKHGETEAKEAKVSESREQKEDVADVVESQESVQEKDPKEQKEQKDELKNDELREVQKVEAELEHPDPKDGAKAQNPETDETDEADEAGSGGKDTETFQAARVHQVFNILDEETRRTRTDSSPRVLEVWKVNPEASPQTPQTAESPRQGQCCIM